jgi:hypothetical protein
MDLEHWPAKKTVTLDEITERVSFALARHPLCREVQFEIVRTPRTPNGSNWTISLQAVATAALWEASDIVADIQAAYDLAVAA